MSYREKENSTIHRSMGIHALTSEFHYYGLFLPVENFCFLGEPDAGCQRITLLTRIIHEVL